MNWPDEYRTSMDDCKLDRCPVMVPKGQCHLKAGHPGEHDPTGSSHWEAQR